MTTFNLKPSELVQQMLDAGATPEACVIALRALEQRDMAEAKRDMAEQKRRAKVAERKRKSRAKQKEGCDSHGTVTGQSQDPSLPPEKVPTPLKTNPPPTLQKRTLKGSKKGSRLPHGWEPTERDVAWFEKNYPGHDWRYETEKFSDHWSAASGQNATKLDWSAAWKNWIRMASDRGNLRRTSQSQERRMFV